MRSSLVLIFVCGALSAYAKPPLPSPGPQRFDAFLASPRTRPFDASRLPRSLREQVKNGLVSSTEPRTGVPTFFWAPRSAQVTDLKSEGVTAEQAARRALFGYAGLWRVDGKRAATEAVAEVHDLGFGAVIVTFTLPEKGLEVFRDEVHVVMNQKLELIALSGSFNPSRRVQGGFSLAPETAIVAAWQDLLGADVSPVATARENGPYRYFAIEGDREVRLKKVYFPLPSGLEPAYYLELHPLREGATVSPYVAYVLSANDGRLLLRNDLARYDSFSYRVWADESDIHRPYDGPQGDDPSPNPTGVVSTYNPPWTMPPLISVASGPISTNDPWLPPASTTTQGNNTYAYADFNAPDGFSAGDITATATATGVFDRTYDVTLAAATSDDQREAAITQLFFNVNFFHDWYYDLGFDEKAGNAQTDNLGRGGLAMDELHAEAQDYSGVDNSNMQTPADGASPVMQMYLFDDGSEPTVVENSPTAANFNAYGGTLGPTSYSVTADLLPIVSGSALGNACSQLLSSAAGKILMVARGGGCQAAVKATNAQNAGAVGLIIVSTGGFVSPPSGTGSTIPVVAMSASDGATLKAAAAAGTVNLTLTHPPVMYRDGAIDNTIVAHEWGHYIQNRLIGDGSGLVNNQGGGMGEGWSDFHAMLLIVRAEDALVASNPNYSGVYALAGYAMQLLEPRAYYFGIRRVPYSTDMSKDGLTFKMIGDGVPLPANVPTAFGLDGSQNSEVHNTGEVWSTMLWECYASLLRDTSRLTFAQAQTRMRSYVVGGYKATPVSPTMLEARDAILATAEASDPVDFGLFVSAFAKRGAGIYALGPDRDSTDNNPVSESFDDGNGAMITSFTLDDSAESCDHDGVLDDGETGVATVTVKNVGVGALSTTHLVISSNSPGLEIQGGADFGPIARLATGTATVKVKANGIAPHGVLTLTATVTDTSFSSGPQALTSTFGSDFDIAPNSSATDDVESPTTAWTTENSSAPDGAWGITGSGNQHWWLAHGAGSPDRANLISPPMIVGTGPFSVSFKERFDFEVQTFGGTTNYFDGAVVEVSDDNGITWTDVGAMMTPGYGGTIAAMMSANPLAGVPALVAQSDSYPSFIDGKIDLGTAYAGKTVQLRFSEGSDDAVGFAGWEIDDIVVTGITNTPFSTVIADPHSCKKVNQAPVVTISGPSEAHAKDMVTLIANATDPNGDPIASYAWTQMAGNPVALTGIGTSTISFAVPTLSTDQHFVFAVKVSDGQLTTTATADVLVHGIAPPAIEQPGKKSGCGCNGVDAMMPMLSVLGLALLRRRRN